MVVVYKSTFPIIYKNLHPSHEADDNCLNNLVAEEQGTCQHHLSSTPLSSRPKRSIRAPFKFVDYDMDSDEKHFAAHCFINNVNVFSTSFLGVNNLMK